MRKSVLLPLAALLLLGGAAAAQPSLPAAQDLLPPPPAAGSSKALAELDELHRLQAAATPDEIAAAAYDDKHEDGSAFASVIGPSFDLAKLSATKALLAAVAAGEDEITKAPKAFFHRDRPWIVDPSIKTCTQHKPGPAANSYPSGHSTDGFAQGEILAQLIPGKAQPLLSRSAQFAENRLICGYHFRSDIVAGQVLGTVLAFRLAAAPAFRSKMEAARSELRAAHIIP